MEGLPKVMLKVPTVVANKVKIEPEWIAYLAEFLCLPSAMVMKSCEENSVGVTTKSNE